MSTELSTTPSEVAEPHSLREVLLFCAVLVVEVYSLAVAFGGPFFEVGYFLLVVISQTTAGAYIWAQLRRTDKSLPLPELLAMGFAIGSASAAISQLIIRDFFGIRIFLSPLVPIICVAIWLIAKRNTRLPVTITHANTNTLLWLLFPAPLAISFMIWELLAFFVIPMSVLIFFYQKMKPNNFYGIGCLVIFHSAIFALINKMTQPFTIAKALTSNDELFDEAHAIGFSNWGIGENIGQAGTSFGYYKLSHLWLGPILEITNSSAMIISMSVATILIFSFIGASVWALSFQLFKSNTTANLTCVFIFLQHSLQEPFNVNLRLTQSLVMVYFIVGICCLIKKWQSSLQQSIVGALAFFVLFATRSQYGIFLLIGLIAFHLFQLSRRNVSVKNFVKDNFLIGVALIVCFFVFFSGSKSAPTTFTNQYSALGLLGVFFGSLVVRVIIPLLVSRPSEINGLGVIIGTILAAFAVSFVMPQATLGEAPTLAISVLGAVLIASQIKPNLGSLTKTTAIVTFLTAGIIGVSLRILYDLYKWENTTSFDATVKFVAKIVTESKLIAVLTLIPIVIYLIGVGLTFGLKKTSINLRPVVFTIAISMTFGVSIATIFRGVTNHFRYEMTLERNFLSTSPHIWTTDPDRQDALNWLRENSEKDDIFAQNTIFPESEYLYSLIMTTSIRRRAYLEAPMYGGVATEETNTRLSTSQDFPSTPSESKLENMINVKWFVVDLGNTELRDWEPWATTRFINEKVAILELNHLSGGES